MSECRGSGKVHRDATGHEIVTNESVCSDCKQVVGNRNLGGFTVALVEHQQPESDEIRPIIRRDGSIDVGIFRIGRVRWERPTWAGPEGAWRALDRDYRPLDLWGTRREAVDQVVATWTAPGR